MSKRPPKKVIRDYASGFGFHSDVAALIFCAFYEPYAKKFPLIGVSRPAFYYNGIVAEAAAKNTIAFLKKYAGNDKVRSLQK